MVYATICEFKLGMFENIVAAPFFALFAFLAIRKIKKLPSTFIANATAMSDDNDVPLSSTEANLLGIANDYYNKYSSSDD